MNENCSEKKGGIIQVIYKTTSFTLHLQSFPITCELGQLKFRRRFFKNNIPLWNESW